MSTGQLRLTLTNSAPRRTDNALGMVEITPAFDSEKQSHVEKQIRATYRTVLSVKDNHKSIALDPGPYVVRMSLPSGMTQAERIEITEGETTDVIFRAEVSPREWYGQTEPIGAVARSPSATEFQAILAGLREPRFGAQLIGASHDLSLTRFVRSEEQNLQLAQHNWYSLGQRRYDLASISGKRIARRARGWSWTSQVDQERQLPHGDLPLRELVQWWTGDLSEPFQRLRLAQAHDYDVRLEAKTSDEYRMWNRPHQRAFAAIQDPMGNEFYAVFPEGWRSISLDSMDVYAKPSILLTVTVETALAYLNTSAASWRCKPQVDDADAMSLLGFLHTDQTGAVHSMMLDRAHRMLFLKNQNPIAAAAGAYALLSMTEEANLRFDRHWRQWVENLYRRFPHVPDGAIAMAQMALSFGTENSAEDVDVEEVRTYALMAVRRGLPYLGVGIPRLTDILTALESDDRTEGRYGPLIEDTRKALLLVRQLGQITVPGSLFTVLRLREVSNDSHL